MHTDSPAPDDLLEAAYRKLDAELEARAFRQYEALRRALVSALPSRAMLAYCLRESLTTPEPDARPARRP